MEGQEEQPQVSTIIGSKRSRESMEVDDDDDARIDDQRSVKRLVNGSEEKESREMMVILDAGSQYGKVIDRRIRELHVESVMLPVTTPYEDIMKFNPKGIIINGSGNSVNDKDPLLCDPSIFMGTIPVLGICYGLQLIVKHFGGKIDKDKVREDGQFEVQLDTKCPLFEHLSEREMVLLTHGESVQMLPDCLKALGWSGDAITALGHVDRPIYGVQFHPEVDLSVNGIRVIKSFLYKICGCQGNFKLQDREDQCIEYIKNTVGNGEVLSFVSGGIDSAVCTILLFKALGRSRVTAVHVDTGFMRKGESEDVVDSLKSLGIDLEVRNERLSFMSAQTVMNYKTMDGNVSKQSTPFLHMAINAEEKRNIIGDRFMEIAEEIMDTMKERTNKNIFLAQGTLRPDLIESASTLVSSNAHRIKTHHNDTELVRELRSKGLVIEPLKDFHKDEVRRLGQSLGLDSKIVNRHPFPGPGLAIRVICQEEAYIDDAYFKSTSTLLNLIVNYASRANERDPGVKLIEDCISDNEKDFLCSFTSSLQLCSTLLPIHSVGVQGDSRSYKYIAALSSDSSPDWPRLMRLAKLLPRICHSINRVVWVFGPPVLYPVTDVTLTRLSNVVLATLREADYVANSILRYSEMEGKISQMPIVLIPIHFDRNHDERPMTPSCQRSIVIRTFISADFMTGTPATPDNQIPLSVIQEMVAAIEQIPGISRVLYDLTPKPPGTTEWE